MSFIKPLIFLRNWMKKNNSLKLCFSLIFSNWFENIIPKKEQMNGKHFKKQNTLNGQKECSRLKKTMSGLI